MGLRFFADQCVPTGETPNQKHLQEFRSFIKLTLARLFLKM